MGGGLEAKWLQTLLPSDSFIPLSCSIFLQINRYFPLNKIDDHQISALRLTDVESPAFP